MSAKQARGRLKRFLECKGTNFFWNSKIIALFSKKASHRLKGIARDNQQGKTVSWWSVAKNFSSFHVTISPMDLLNISEKRPNRYAFLVFGVKLYIIS